MTAVRTLAAWPLALVGSLLVGVGILLSAPFLAVGWSGVCLLQAADRLLRRSEVGDDTVAMLAAHEDELWRSYMTHPGVREQAADRVRGNDNRGNG